MRRICFIGFLAVLSLPTFYLVSFVSAFAMPAKADNFILTKPDSQNLNSEEDVLWHWAIAPAKGPIEFDLKPENPRQDNLRAANLVNKSKENLSAIDVDKNTLDGEWQLVSAQNQTNELKSLGEMIVRMRRKLTDDPHDFGLHFCLALDLFTVGDYQGALTEIKAAAELRPLDAPVKALTGRILDLIGCHDQALIQFRRSVEIADGQVDSHLLFAESLRHGGNFSEAINEYRRAIGIKPGASALAGLSESLLVSGDVIGAVKSARQAVSLQPGSAQAQIALTSALLQSGDGQAALRTARQAMLLSPDLPDSHLVLGRCLFLSGCRAAAVEEFKQAVSLDPLNARARNDLGYALYGQGDILMAINEYRLALRLSPGLAEARNNLEVAVHTLAVQK